MSGAVMSEEMISRTTIPATFVSFRRGLRRIYPRHALVKIENVTSRNDAGSYIGNGVVCYKMGKEKERHPVHGVITRVHGNSGVVCARFSRNLNPKSIGSSVFIKLYKVESDEI